MTERARAFPTTLAMRPIAQWRRALLIVRHHPPLGVPLRPLRALERPAAGGGSLGALGLSEPPDSPAHVIDGIADVVGVDRSALAKGAAHLAPPIALR